ncbi:MAG: hypothetical protein RIC55_21385 [Pirellulaceae bacterium]
MSNERDLGRVQLHEHSTSTPLRIDAAAGVMREVKVVGRRSRNGRTYTTAALRAALPLYEGIRVNIDHPRRGAGDSHVSDRFGVLRRVRLRTDGIVADLHYLTRHPLAEMIVEAARRMPEALGLSHNAEGRAVVRDGLEVVEEITRVASVDLVSNPATTAGLFESSMQTHYEQSITGGTLADAVQAGSRIVRVRGVK